jgi:glycosyltransferase involved in cell wall biosynthesis
LMVGRLVEKKGMSFGLRAFAQARQRDHRDGQTGFLVPERDVGALAEALRELLGSHALRTRLGEAARAKMEREYDARRQNAALEQLLLGTL